MLVGEQLSDMAPPPAPGRVRGAIDRLNERVAEVPVDLLDQHDEYVLEADLPGYRTQDIDVTVRPRMVRITVTPERSGPGGVRTSEDRGYRKRLVRLPEPVEAQSASASYHNGVLRVTVEKAGSAASTDVPIE